MFMYCAGITMHRAEHLKSSDDTPFILNPDPASDVIWLGLWPYGNLTAMSQASPLEVHFFLFFSLLLPLSLSCQPGRTLFLLAGMMYIRQR